jgi:adrenodoxin-NADP+ reductase
MFKLSLLKPSKNFLAKSFFSSSSLKNSIFTNKQLQTTPKICIVGSGPAALYTAQYLVKNLNQNPFKLDIYEKLPVPFGLVRYGVAPDHQDVKNCINSFSETLKNTNVNFYGNVNIGHDLRIDELLNAYNFVILAYGSHSENYLNIPGETKDTQNLHSAKDIVSWYNGLPSQYGQPLKLDLSGRRAVIIGAGNVAIDIARLLTSPHDKLSQTDISAKALDIIKKTNQIDHVSIVARRGVLNAAFTLKELRELTKLAPSTVQCRIDLDYFKQIDIERLLPKLSRPRRRLTEYMYKIALDSTSAKFENNGKKTIDLKFLRKPLEILLNKENSYVNGVKFQLSKYDEFVLFSENTKFDSEEGRFFFFYLKMLLN